MPVEFTSKDRSSKYRISLLNYVAGGPLVSVHTTEESHRSSEQECKTTRPRPRRRTVYISTDESSGGEDEPDFVINLSKNKTTSGGKKKDGEKKSKEEAKEDAKKSDNGKESDNAEKSDKAGKSNDEKSKESKSTEEKSKDNNKSEEKKGFTAEQDAKILEMKAKNSSWKDIGQEVGASKNDVKNRYHEISPSTPATTSEENKKENGKGKEKEKEPEVAESSFGDIDSTDNLNDAFLDDFDDLFFEDNEKKEEDSKKSKKDKKGKGKGKAKETTPQEESNDNDEEAASRSPFLGFGCGGVDSARYYKYSGKLHPDIHFTKHDCEVLEMLKATYEENKWLHIQAGFYNWTGRMIPGDEIERKFKRDGLES